MVLEFVLLALQENAVLTDEGEGDGEGDPEADVSCEECEVTDECAMLLNPSIGVTPNTLRKVLKTPSNKYGTHYNRPHDGCLRKVCEEMFGSRSRSL